MTAARFHLGRDGLYYPATRAAIELADARKKITLNAADLVEIKLAGIPVTLMNGEPIVTEVMA